MYQGDELISRAETLALLYLVVPLFLFFAFFIRLELAIPACALIAFLLIEIVRRTRWRAPVASPWIYVYFLFLVLLWLWLSHGPGGLHQNVDWFKHHAITNFLTENPWPAEGRVGDLGDATLRYSLGWYLVPALVLKITGGAFQNLVLLAWSALGVILFFSLLPSTVGNARAAMLIAPLVFIVFGGADLLGAFLSGYGAGPKYHFEWWASWIEFPANTTSLYWVPQHALPAWLGIALLMRQNTRPTLLRYAALLTSAIAFWSPFIAMGLLPFLAALAWRHGLKNLAFDWRAVAATFLLAGPLGLYLVAGAESIPAGFIASVPCIPDHPHCFTWGSYALFLFIEITLVLIILFLRNPKENFLVAAAITLCLIPLYRIGIYNDFAMRASIPALAVLAILSAKTLVAGPPRYSAAVVVVLLLALPTSVGEIYRGFLHADAGIRPETTFDDPWAAQYLRQYFAPLPVWVLRE